MFEKDNSNAVKAAIKRPYVALSASVVELAIAIPTMLGTRKIIKTATSAIKPEGLSPKDEVLWAAGEWGAAVAVASAVSNGTREAIVTINDLAWDLKDVVAAATATAEEDPTIIDGEIVSEDD